MTRADPFSDFINQHLNLGDEPFIPIAPPAPTDPRWHYGKYQAATAVTVYSQPDTHFASATLQPTNGYAHAMLRFLPEIRLGWTAIELTIR